VKKAVAKKQKAKAVEAPPPTEEDGLSVPGFLRRTEQPAKEPTTSFGMVSNAPPPTDDVNAALQKAFALPGV
jgi:hypothetical protein